MLLVDEILEVPDPVDECEVDKDAVVVNERDSVWLGVVEVLSVREALAEIEQLLVRETEEVSERVLVTLEDIDRVVE